MKSFQPLWAPLSVLNHFDYFFGMSDQNFQHRNLSQITTTFFCCVVLRRLSCHLLCNSPLASWIQQLALGLLLFKEPNLLPLASPCMFSSTFSYLSNSLSHLVLHSCTFSSWSTPCCLTFVFAELLTCPTSWSPVFTDFFFFFFLCWLKGKPVVTRLNGKVRSCK